MNDPMIQELFPDKKPISSDQVISSAKPGARPEFAAYYGNIRSGPDYFRGEYDLSYTTTHYGSTFFPSFTARNTFLFLQLLCSATCSKEHYTKRKDLSSYLMAQTFYGRGTLRYDNKEYELLPGDLFFIDCRSPHEYFASSDDGWGYRFLHFDGSGMTAYFSHFRAGRFYKFTFMEDSHFTALLKELFLVTDGSDLNKEIITHRILTDMITELLCILPQHRDDYQPDSVRLACDFIQNSFREKLTLEQIADHIGLSKFYMSREFKKYTGKTIFSYVIDCRIAYAQRLLRFSNMSVNEIAEYVGFEDHNNFYRAFYKREGMSPTSYRKYWTTF